MTRVINNSRPDKVHSPIRQSFTVPNQTYTIRQLFERMREGLPMPQARSQTYYESDYYDVESVEPLSTPIDLSDITDMNFANLAAQTAKDSESERSSVADEPVEANLAVDAPPKDKKK
ncbi:hypothetical protein [Tortoise microvirus 52]|nr:hypothetical protein [Tortoise microvirus 52]